MTQQEPGSAAGESPLLDYATVSRYWSKAKPSIMGPYMMDGFGFPPSAGSYRFDAEREIVDRLIDDAGVGLDGKVLDLGSGVGFWAEYFAQRFGEVVAIEASTPICSATSTGFQRGSRNRHPVGRVVSHSVVRRASIGTPW